MNLEKSILDMFEGLSKVDFNLVVEYTGVLFAVFWIVVLIWVWFDCKERTESIFLRFLAVVVVFIGSIPGLIIYLILRPKITLSEQYWSDLERRYLIYETAELDDCEKCGVMLQPGFVYCPNCRESVKVKCESCGVNINKGWRNCPYCGVVNSSAVLNERKVVRFESFSEFLMRNYNSFKAKIAQKKVEVDSLEVQEAVNNSSSDSVVTRNVLSKKKRGKKKKNKRYKNKR